MSNIIPAGEMVYGIQLPIHTLTKTLRAPWEENAGVDDLVSIAQKCEATGHFFVGICDHIAIPQNDYAANMSTTWYDTIATLSYLAAHTSSIRLLSVVWIAAYRHPLQTAKAFATLDHLSGGRVILGVGAGHVEAEFEALGIDFQKRGQLLDECLDGIKAALEPGEFSSFSGDTYSWDNCGVGPKPPQGEIPVWIGGTSKPAFRRTAQRGDGWIPMGNPKESLPEIFDFIKSEAAKSGRENAEFDFGYMPPSIYVGSPPEDLPPSLGGWLLSGSPDQIAEELNSVKELGVRVLHLRFASRSLEEYLDQLDAFGAQVTPLLN